MSEVNYTGQNEPVLSICDFDALYLSLAAYKSLSDVLPGNSPILSILAVLERSLEQSIDDLAVKVNVK
jgi:hypothetical protein